MEYDSSIIGEKVVDASGREGTVVKPNTKGAVKVKFNGDCFGGEYMVDPFLSGYLRFVNPELQKPIDVEIGRMRQELIEMVNNCVAQEGDVETFYITKDNKDKTKEIIYRLKCDKEKAYKIFSFVVSEQQKEVRASKFSIKWRVVRMFDAKNNEQICQES